MFKRITCVDNIMLIGSFGEMEIKETNWECGSAKSSGPDTVTFLDSLKSFGRLLREMCLTSSMTFMILQIL